MIRQGLLWYDDSKTRGLAEKISRAAARYAQRFGTEPNVCRVNPDDIGNVGAVGAVKVTAVKTVLRHHIWLGVES